MLTLAPLGAAGTVTGSKHLLTCDGHHILIDCGLFQGLKNLRELNWEKLPVQPHAIDAVILTHAHLDYCGYLPPLVRDGFRGRIYATEATRDVTELILMDSAFLKEKDAEFLNRHHLSKHNPKAITASRYPKIIIAASGMATGGRVLHHLKVFGPDPRCTILLSGFQSPGTRGRTLQQGAKGLKVHGDWVPINAEVAQLDMLSAHADGDELMRWLSVFKRAPRRVFIVHGEPEASKALRVRIERELAGYRATAGSGVPPMSTGIRVRLPRP